ncbi:MAG: hypothetical protein HQK55_14530 [Deltaproteobacteria bacterium]|nr:hypothetical protein [Deltaproteobacteria bacterium]
MTKQQIIKTLMLSPFYFSLSLSERSSVIEGLQQRIREGFPEQSMAEEKSKSVRDRESSAIQNISAES